MMTKQELFEYMHAFRRFGAVRQERRRIIVAVIDDVFRVRAGAVAAHWLIFQWKNTT